MEHFYCASSLKMQWWTVSSIPMYQLTQHQWWVEYRNDANKSWKSNTVDQDPRIMHTSTKRFSANNKYSTAICFCYSIIIWRIPSPLNPQNPLILPSPESPGSQVVNNWTIRSCILIKFRHIHLHESEK